MGNCMAKDIVFYWTFGLAKTEEHPLGFDHISEINEWQCDQDNTAGRR
jgi:hypothetical protein